MERTAWAREAWERHNAAKREREQEAERRGWRARNARRHGCHCAACQEDAPERCELRRAAD
jgi:hypothetical protein